MKFETIVYKVDGDIEFIVPDVLYQPVGGISINGYLYRNWSQFDMYAHTDFIRRKIFLHSNENDVMWKYAHATFPQILQQIAEKQVPQLN